MKLWNDYDAPGHTHSQLSSQIGRIFTKEKKKEKREEVRVTDLSAGQRSADSQNTEGEDSEDEEGEDEQDLLQGSDMENEEGEGEGDLVVPDSEGHEGGL